MSPCQVHSWQGLEKAVLCLVLLSGLVSCLKDYYLETELKTFFEAEAICLKKYSQVASINSQSEMDAMLAVAAGEGYEGEVWIGRRDFGGWEWDMFGGGYYNWSQGEPNATGILLCTGMWQDTGMWFDYNCGSMTLPFVCYNDTSSPDVPIFAPERYVYVNHTTDHGYCQVLNFTGLAGVRDATENEVIRQMLPVGTSVLLTMTRSFFAWWTDDSSFSYSNWVDGEPKHSHGCASSLIDPVSSGKWVSRSCGDQLHFMCYTDKTTIWKVGMKALTTTADLNDPAVAAAILKNIEVKMTPMMKYRFKIYWNKASGAIFSQKTSDASDTSE